MTYNKGMMVLAIVVIALAMSSMVVALVTMKATHTVSPCIAVPQDYRDRSNPRPGLIMKIN